MLETVLSFESNTIALKADKILSQKGITYLVVPSPRRCGLCIRFSANLLEEVCEVLKEGGVTWITQN